MKAVILGGEKPRNEEWANRVVESTKWLFAPREVFRYLNWQEEQSRAKIDVIGEVARLKEHLAAEEDQYVVIAKSAGCWVLLKALQDQAIVPARVILMGLPVDFKHDQIASTDALIQGYAGPPALFIQQKGEGDPANGSVALRQLVEDSQLENARVIGIPGEDHHYNRLDTVTSLISVWLAEVAANECVAFDV